MNQQRLCSPRWVDAHHGDEPQGDPAVEPPLLDGRGEADDADQQEVEIFKVLLCHLEENRNSNTVQTENKRNKCDVSTIIEKEKIRVTIIHQKYKNTKIHFYIKFDLTKVLFKL